MRQRRTFIAMSLAGSFIIYTAMAACSGSVEHPTSSSSGATGHGGHGHGGASAQSGHGGAGGSHASGIIDAMTDPVSEASADTVSGSRLKAYYETGDDGSKAYLPGTWWDSTRGEDCSSRIAGDGKLRCLPTDYGYPFNIQYMDPSCTQLVMNDPGKCNGFKYMVSQTSNGCSQQFDYRPVMSQVMPATIYMPGPNNTCVPSGPPNPSLIYIQIGPVVPPSSFVLMSKLHD
jgi:hypothetical protein